MWSNIIGQKRVINILKRAYKNNRIAQSYIFYGKDGIGKDAVGIEFAKFLNCENKDIDNGACDKCKSCISISSLTSSYFKFITSLPAGKRDSKEGENPVLNLKESDLNIYLSEIQKKSKNYYYKLNIPGANNIRIESIRQIIREIYLTTELNKTKVFLISDCENMNIQSANAFLKILEEPPKNSLLILTTSKLNSLLPTILGRCQKIKFDLISNSDLKKYIKSIKTKLSEEEINFYASLSEGSILKCNEVINSDYLELREEMIDSLRNLLTNSFIDLHHRFTNVLSLKNKNKLKLFLFLLSTWFRDIILYTNGINEKIINKDKMENINNFSKRYKSDNYKIISLIEDTIREIDMNVNQELLLINLYINIGKNIKKLS